MGDLPIWAIFPMVTKVGQLYVGPQPQYFIRRYECLLDELKLTGNLLIRTLQIDPYIKVTKHML
jgi:hypothetical protein